MATMPGTARFPRRSPLHALLAELAPQWTEIAGMTTPLRYGDLAREAELAKTLALCDASGLPRVAIKGSGAQEFLTGLGFNVSGTVYRWDPLPEGGLIARTGSSEFFVEDGPRGDCVVGLERALKEAGSSVFRVPRQDASLLLSGSRAGEALAQTCGYDFGNFDGTDSPVVFTRVAGVSCSILRRPFGNLAAVQIWVDGTYGAYLWKTLLSIVTELNGGPAGIAAFFPELAGEG